MSEEQKQKQKQYLLVVEEDTMALLGKIITGIRYIEVEGMHVPGNEKHQFLVNPLPVEVMI